MSYIFCYWNDPETLEHRPIGILESGLDPFSVIAEHLIDTWNWELDDIDEQRDNIRYYEIQSNAVESLRSIQWPDNICSSALNTVKMRVHAAFKID